EPKIRHVRAARITKVCSAGFCLSGDNRHARTATACTTNQRRQCVAMKRPSVWTIFVAFAVLSRSRNAACWYSRSYSHSNAETLARQPSRARDEIGKAINQANQVQDPDSHPSSNHEIQQIGNPLPRPNNFFARLSSCPDLNTRVDQLARC